MSALDGRRRYTMDAHHCLTRGLTRLAPGVYAYPIISGAARYLMGTALVGRTGGSERYGIASKPLDLADRCARYDLALASFGLGET